MENSFWFKHDYDAAGDELILELRLEYGTEGDKAYGWFWILLETMVKKSTTDIALDRLGGLAAIWGVDASWLRTFVDTCVKIGLFVSDGEYITSERLQAHKAGRKAKSDKRRDAAKARWGADLSKSNANAKQKQSTSNAEERRGEEREDIYKGDKNTGEGKGKRSKPFTAPNPEELSVYILDYHTTKNITLTVPTADRYAEKFIHSYEQKGWMVGKNKMKDWKAGVRNWVTNGWFSDNGQAAQPTTQPPSKLRF